MKIKQIAIYLLTAFMPLVGLFFIGRQIQQGIYLRYAYHAILANSPAELAKWLQGSSVNKHIILANGTRSTLLIQAIIHKPDDVQAHELVRMLLATKHINPNEYEIIARNGAIGRGRTPINWAVERGNVEAVRLLVQHGANINSEDPLTGKSPLAFVQGEKDPQLRAEWHLDEIESLLKKHGAQ